MPKAKGRCSIDFLTEDFEVENIRYEHFSALGKARIKASLYGFALQIDMGFIDGEVKMNFRIEDHTLKNSAKRISKIQRILFLLANGSRFRIETDSDKVSEHEFPQQAVAQKFWQYYDFFSQVASIEKALRIDFGPLSVNDFDEEALLTVKKITSLIRNKYYAIKDVEGLIMEKMPASEKLYKAIWGNKIKGAYLFLTSDHRKSVQLFDKVIDLGYEQIALFDPILEAIEPFGGKATLFAKDDIIIYRYQQFGHYKPTGAFTLWSANSARKNRSI